MKKVFVVYKTDSLHSYASRNIIGIATAKAGAISLCKKQAYKEHCHISREQAFNLENISQTQGYNGEGEFQFEEMLLNTLL